MAIRYSRILMRTLGPIIDPDYRCRTERHPDDIAGEDVNERLIASEYVMLLGLYALLTIVAVGLPVGVYVGLIVAF